MAQSAEARSQCTNPAGLQQIQYCAEASGYQVTLVNTMLPTHLNPDHAYGLADAEGTPTGPNVRGYVPHQEAEL
ncbi:MAG: hypothetical protein R3260_13390 [Pseudomonas sp.]|nr:hypothetical protein [Pseudomonas sp.]